VLKNLKISASIYTWITAAHLHPCSHKAAEVSRSGKFRKNFCSVICL